MKSLLTFTFLIAILFLCQKSSAQSVTLDHVDGLYAGNETEIIADGSSKIKFHIRFTNNNDSHGGIANGFRVYSDNGATWGTMVGDTVGLGKALFDGGYFISPFSVDGSGADTIGFGAFRFFGPGLPGGYNDIAYTIEIGPINPIYHGRTICLDSAFYPPSGEWKWAGPDVYPIWDGPHCFTCIDPATLNLSVSIDSVGGLYENNPDQIMADGSTEVSFFIHLNNNNVDRNGISNGFRIFSDDGATWGNTNADTISLGWDSMFDLDFYAANGNSDGAGADTVLFSGFNFFGSGLPAYFDERAYKITIGPIDMSNHNKTICIDSSFYAPSGVWWWSPGIIVDWSGVRCFTCINPNPTDVDEIYSDQLPDKFLLSQNYPNPFNPETKIDYTIKRRSNVTISIYNLIGQKINSLVNEEKPAGNYYVTWDGSDFAGKKVASGIYFYRLRADEYTETKKMILMK